MVYRGKPSAGCKKCRQRKIKCDERPGACAKCAEKGYTCPGYDNMQDRYFQDETAHVEKKAKKAKAKAIALRDERDVKAKYYAAIESIQDSIGMQLLCPIVDQGIAFFMSNHAVGMDKPPMESEAYNRHLSTDGFHPLIATSMTALGLAGIANVSMNAHFKREAIRWYAKALRMTNAALASPSEVKSDNTLLATMLLGMFETTSNELSLLGWSSHVDGSASILRMRGKSTFATPAGRRMFMQTVGCLTMNCMGRGTSLPEYIHDLNKENAKYESANDPGDRFYHLNIDTIDFRAQILNGQLTDLREIIDKALELDGVAHRVFENVIPEWDYEEVHTDSELPGVFGKIYHIYGSLAAAQTWNWVRYNRIYLHDIIRNCILAGFSKTPPVLIGDVYMRLLDASTQTLYRMQAEIFASIPQHLHDTTNLPLAWNRLDGGMTSDSSEHYSSQSPTSPSSAGSLPKYLWTNFRFDRPMYQSKAPATAVPQDQLPIIRVSGGYSSLWALYIAGATAVATPESQDYVLRTFKRITKECGINQGMVLASALRLKIALDKNNSAPVEIVPTYLPKVGTHVEAGLALHDSQY